MNGESSHAARLFVDGPLRPGTMLELPERAAHHALRVLRLREGDLVTLFDGRGGEWDATLARGGAAAVGAWRDIEREARLQVTLVQGVSAGERMDLTVQKATELGVAAIQPVLARKSVVRIAGARADARVEHWRRVAIAACEQCGRNRIPEVLAPVPLAQYCRAPSGALRLLLAPDARTNLSAATARGAGPVTLAVGPESGFDAAEEALLARAGFVAVRLGARVLRTETAAPAALAALAALAGEF
ncbi:MAG TPA: 16S rRNA (uracil(1498)-N(3))-methyltransferase [Burkholderiales bacterium]|nr:16S rRNA (uracil(1498)-N(3))-methyltransferase [Burkholderiales bacterium]